VTSDAIRRRIERVYGSLDHPAFHFVGAALESRPYAALRERLAARLDLRDDTRPDDDVSFGFVIETREGRRVLRLSMVGPYALLLRIVTGAPAEVVSAGSALGADEARIVAELARDGIELLDRATLDERIPLAVWSTPPDETRLYQALFVDSDVIPWEWFPSQS